jgi:uncharacterized protein (TIGR02271 family)
MTKEKGFFGLFDQDDHVDTEIAEDENMLLREEELDIAKDRFKAGEVTLHKDIVEDRKTVDVPVMHEEVSIERKALDHRHSDTPIGREETIHIPVSQERIDVGKHTELVGEVSARKKNVEETQNVDETLKKEKARVDVDGNPHIAKSNWDRNKH